MENGTIILIFTVLIVLWLVGLTLFLVRFVKSFRVFTKGVTKKDLTSVLEKLYTELAVSQKKLVELEERTAKQENEAAFKLEKLGLLRFNPFADTGGEQSFVVSLLDYNNSGMVLSSLQGRTGTRWYVKQVKKGKGVEFDLSKEEQEAVKKAKILT